MGNRIGARPLHPAGAPLHKSGRPSPSVSSESCAPSGSTRAERPFDPNATQSAMMMTSLLASPAYPVHPRRMRPALQPQIATLRRDGFAVVPNFVPGDALKTLRGVALRELAARAPP